ncbi:MAG: methyltransferase domain-containing protein [Bacteroidales bacterium]|nr:methyltransferase domain-containing protein [Bacteroidales bacterium]
MKKIFPVALLRFGKRLVRKTRYYGNKCQCPVCNSSLNGWKPTGYDFPVIREMQIVGSGYRLALCPVCGASDRIRLLYFFLKNKTEILKKSLKLLHIAPNEAIKRVLRTNQNLDYLSADINPDMVMEQMDITGIQYPDDTFDAIICNHVLEHIPEDRKAMKELYRVLKPGGWAILQVPFSKISQETFEVPEITKPEDREKYFGQNDHVRIYGLDYPNRLKQAGFRVEQYKWTEDENFINPGNQFGLNPDEIVFFATKP